MRKWFTAKQLAGLPGQPLSVQGVNLRAKRESWETRPRHGRGGGREYLLDSLPIETQSALTNSEALSAADTAPADVLVALRALLDLALAESWGVGRFKRLAIALLAEGNDHA